LLVGQSDGGGFKFVPVDQFGHLEVALHAPRLPFGSIHTENLTPIFQTDAVYTLNPEQVTPGISGSGSVTVTDGVFRLSSGTTIFSQATLQSRKRLRYRPGQGIVGRFTARYSPPVANSYQLVGFGHAEDGVYFGYGNTSDLSDTSFGILYSRRGQREIKTLTITAGATSNGNVTITLNGTDYVVAVTNASNIQRTVYEISRATYAGWRAFPLGATVVFVANAASPSAGSQSFNPGTTGSTGSIVQTRAGAASTETFIPQSSWNGDPLDGTGPSGAVIDPTKGNVFEIGIQYLGFGALSFRVEIASPDNNAAFYEVHTIRLPNTLTQSSFRNPSFPFTMAVYSAGSTTDLTVESASFAGFIEGEKRLNGGRFSYLRSTSSAVGDTTIYPLFTILNSGVYGTIPNQAVINVLSMLGAVKSNQPLLFYLIRNGTLLGNPNFQTHSAQSCSLVDTSATGVTFADNAQLIWSGHLGETGDLDHTFDTAGREDLTIQPFEYMTLAAKTVAATAAYATGSVNTREDQ